MAKKHLSEDEIRYIISGDSSKLQEELHTLTKDTKALKKEESERRKAMVELEAKGKKTRKSTRTSLRSVVNTVNAFPRIISRSVPLTVV